MDTEAIEELKAFNKKGCIGTVKIQFSSDSGYESCELLRLRQDQWERITEILKEE